MGQRLANGGYIVLLPDLFYRAGRYEPMDPKKVFATGDVMGAIGHLFNSTNNRRAAEDTEAFLAYLDTRDDLEGRKVGTTGYCMGGGMSLTAAGTYPDRVAAAASFHGGNLATESELSPHRLAPRIKGRVYVAGAESNAVAVFARDEDTSVLHQLGGRDGCASEDGSNGDCSDGIGLDRPVGLAVPRDGNHVYATAGNSTSIAVLARDRHTPASIGALTSIACLSTTDAECSEQPHLSAAIKECLEQATRLGVALGGKG
jgi:dienelactone hydrolase